MVLCLFDSSIGFLFAFANTTFYVRKVFNNTRTSMYVGGDNTSLIK